MPQIFPGRYTAQTDAPFVVFLIGIRVNHFLQFSKWMPVAKAMPPMIEELKRHSVTGRLDNARARMSKTEADSIPQA